MIRSISSVHPNITGLGVISAIARGTKRRFKRSTFSGTTGSLATSYLLGEVVFEAARDVARLVGLGEDKVEEKHRERRIVCQR